MNMLRGTLLASLLVLLAGCGDDERAQALDPNDGKNFEMEDDVDDGLDEDAGSRDAGSEDDEVDASAGRDAGVDAGTDGGADAGPKNCGDIVCAGHGSCVQDDGLLPTCVCDEGYMRVEENGEYECVVDKNCRKLRTLETSCRQVVNGSPAVALFFAVDYCAGTAVLPEDLGDPAEAFQILENDNNIKDNQESSATIIERDVESFVTIALDVSDSVADVENNPAKKAQLQALVAQLRSFVQSLKAPPGEPEVTVSILVFGRVVAEYVAFTTNLTVVDAALQGIEQDPARVVGLVGGDGTALHPAVTQGIQSVERIMSLRNVVSQGGVLATGTLVVVTDGDDTSGADLDSRLIDETLVNLISIGISDRIDDDTLTTIGRDGSFLAPKQEDWQQAFEEITERVDQYPDRAYLLAYCSSAITGEPVVSVSLSGDAPDSTASCKFSADLFSRDPGAVCDLSYFEGACDGRACGGFLACGACAADQCCSDGVCQAPSAVQGDCADQDQLCAAEGKLCVDNPDLEITDCQDPIPDGQTCDLRDDNCIPGESFCQEGLDGADDICQPLQLENGGVCGSSSEKSARICPELNCATPNPDNPAEPFVCMREARVFEACSGSDADAECEPGSFCAGGSCQARELWECTRHEDCASGRCNEDTKRCVQTGACYFDWNAKLEF